MPDRHPNFPPSLSITPYVISTKSGSHPASSENSNDAEVFGIEAQREAISKYGIAGRIWEAAYALITYIDSNNINGPLEYDPPFSEHLQFPLSVIELGSGTGIVSSVVAKAMRSSVGPRGVLIATDLPDVCPPLKRNLGVVGSEDSSNNSNVFVRPLTWGNLDHAMSIAGEFGFDESLVSTNSDSSDDPLHPPKRLTHILCSDLVYFPELLGPLLRSLLHLTSPPCISSLEPPIQVVISYKIRSLPKETPFWSAFGLWFSFQPVLVRRRIHPAIGRTGTTSYDDHLLSESDINPWRQFGSDDDADRTFIFVAYRRPESISWHVPESDADLIGGVGARGTSAKKADETFETLLLMGVDTDSVE